MLRFKKWRQIKIFLSIRLLLLLKIYHSFFNRLRKELVLFIPAAAIVGHLLKDVEKFLRWILKCLFHKTPILKALQNFDQLLQKNNLYIEFQDDDPRIYIISFVFCVCLPFWCELWILNSFKVDPNQKVIKYNHLQSIFFLMITLILFQSPFPILLFVPYLGLYIILWYMTDHHLRQTQLNIRFDL